eukprot:7009814-Karenia_brevis.AAC.1
MKQMKVGIEEESKKTALWQKDLEVKMKVVEGIGEEAKRAVNEVKVLAAKFQEESTSKSDVHKALGAHVPPIARP